MANSSSSKHPNWDQTSSWDQHPDIPGVYVPAEKVIEVKVPTFWWLKILMIINTLLLLAIFGLAITLFVLDFLPRFQMDK